MGPKGSTGPISSNLLNFAPPTYTCLSHKPESYENHYSYEWSSSSSSGSSGSSSSGRSSSGRSSSGRSSSGSSGSFDGFAIGGADDNSLAAKNVASLLSALHSTTSAPKPVQQSKKLSATLSDSYFDDSSFDELKKSFGLNKGQKLSSPSNSEGDNRSHTKNWALISNWSSDTDTTGHVNNYKDLTTAESEKHNINGKESGYKAASGFVDDNGKKSSFSWFE
ncbi:hypothetical protein ACLKA7_002032 [Drosophila subpalustris]